MNLIKTTAIATTALLYFGTINAAETHESIHSEAAHYFSGEAFRSSEHWIAAEKISPTNNGFSFEQDNKGSYLLTPSEVDTNLENRSSHIQSIQTYGDQIVKLEFILLPDTELDLMLMGRYPIRLSSKSEAQGLAKTGAIGASWDRFNKTENERSFAGFEPISDLALKENEWHNLEVRFRAPRFDESHNKISDAFFLSVKINDLLVQENILAPLPSINALRRYEAERGPLSVDAISGQSALGRIEIARADFSRINVPEESRQATNEQTLTNIVSEGKNAFSSYGCAECHSVKKDDESIKTGPNLYGLFTLNARKRWVENQEQHRYEVRADLNYLSRSIRNAEAELAITEQGSKKDQAYLPIMPRYLQATIPDKEISAILAYLKLLNGPAQQGPVEQLEPASGPQIYDPMQDAMQFLVQNRIRVQRGPIPGLSGRAIHVGHPNGINYSFDPRNLTVSKIWQGGFLETSGELSGRGGHGFATGYDSVEVNLGEQEALLHPFNEAGNKIDFSFKEPKYRDLDQLTKNTYSDSLLEEQIAKQSAYFKGYFRDSSDPLSPVTFFFNIDKNNLSVTHEFDSNGHVSISVDGSSKTQQRFAINQVALSDINVSAGIIENGIWILPKAFEKPLKLTAKIKLIQNAWLPEQKDFDYEQQPLLITDSNASLPPGYQIESWAGPKDNVGRDQLFEAIGIDTVENGDILVSTRTAGVWRLREGQWQLFAEGIFDSLGILSESKNGRQAVVSNKAELTRISDINGDGIADHFETLFDGFANGSNYHSYMHGPVRDLQGNYIIALNLGHGAGIPYKGGGSVMGTHGGYLGWAFQISPDGTYEKLANGLRSPAGLGVDPQGQVWYVENQGDFVASSKIFKLEKGAFYGHPASLIDEPEMTPESAEIQWENVIERKAQEAIVVAHGQVASSLGHLAWDTTQGGFGPFSNHALIGDQTQSNLNRVFFEKVGEHWQGVMIPFATGMESGVMKPIYLPDHSLLLGQTGRGWQAKGGNIASLQRITYDGKTVHQAIKEVNITKDGFKVTLTQAIPEVLKTLEINEWANIESWTYRDAPSYGSEEMGQVKEPLASVKFEDDGKTIFIRLGNPNIPNIHPQQTARIFRIELQHESLNTNAMTAYYSAHRFHP